MHALLHDLGHGDIHTLLRRAILYALTWYKKRSFHDWLPDLGHWHGPDLLPDKPIHVTFRSQRHQHSPDLLHDSFKTANTTRKPERGSRSVNAARRVLLRIVVVTEPTSSMQAVRTQPSAKAPGHVSWATHVALNKTHRRCESHWLKPGHEWPRLEPKDDSQDARMSTSS